MQSALPASLPESKADQVNAYMMKAKKLVKVQVKLAVEAPSEAQCVASIINSRAGQIKGTKTYNDRDETEHRAVVMIVYDAKRFGEATSQPHLRCPAIKDGRMSKLVSVALKAREGLQSCDVHMFYDGMKHHNEALLTQAFKADDGSAIPKHKRTLSLLYSESSLNARLRCHKGYSCTHQIEMLHMVTAEALKLPKVDRLHYEGTSRGQAIGPIQAPAFDAEEAWKLTQAEKKALFGKLGRIAVGGSVSIAEEAKPVRRDPSTPEPVFFHAHPQELDEEIVHCWPAASIIDMTGASPSLSMIAIRKRIPYLGFCFTAEHVAKLTERLEKLTFEAMKVEGDKLHEPGLCELLKGASNDDDDAEDEEGEEEEKVEDPEENDDEEEGEEEQGEDDEEDDGEPGGGKGGKKVKKQAKTKKAVKKEDKAKGIKALQAKLAGLYKKK